ncbi:site-specific integrase [Hoeflea sp. WL0058]|uniref:Site-specific integrase n=2 Tax=Flavimaribacter sediminis TaxID=2865987 RepID=A0AAE2ZSJ0_9HYPH|nr:site-specific integrase [Flavimaribacter sediminis]
MSRPSKGARLVWRRESRKKNGNIRNAAGWYIEDGGKRFSTGCGKDGRVEADQKLAAYISAKYAPSRHRDRSPDQVKVADIISVYLEDRAPFHKDPKETGARLLQVLTFFGRMHLSDINGNACRRYASEASTPAAARRQLEDLRAAINHYYAEGYVTAVPAVILPNKPIGRQRWLTRHEAARLLWAAWRMKQSWKGQESDRRTGRHVARFILIGLYTGTRSGAICGAAIRPKEGCGYVDLEQGVFFRRSAKQQETKKRQPPVRIPDRLLAHLRRWSTTPLEIKTKNRGKSKNIGRMISEDYVVEWSGKPVSSVKKGFKAACEAAGLGWYAEDGLFQTDVTPHVLRHTAATWLMQNGATLSDAADYLGMTEAVLRSTYYHHHPDFQADAAARITAKRPLPKRATNSNVVNLG